MIVEHSRKVRRSEDEERYLGEMVSTPVGKLPLKASTAVGNCPIGSARNAGVARFQAPGATRLFE